MTKNTDDLVITSATDRSCFAQRCYVPRPPPRIQSQASLGWESGTNREVGMRVFGMRCWEAGRASAAKSRKRSVRCGDVENNGDNDESVELASSSPSSLYYAIRPNGPIRAATFFLSCCLFGLLFELLEADSGSSCKVRARKSSDAVARHLSDRRYCAKS